jgi:hypothetical protein
MSRITLAGLILLLIVAATDAARRGQAAPGYSIYVSSFLPTIGNALDVEVQDHLAYVAAASGGLRVIDVSDPALPFEVGSVEGGMYAKDVEIVGGLAFVAVDACDASTGLRIVDVADPTAPVEIGAAPTSHRATGVQVVGNLAYVLQFPNSYCPGGGDPSAGVRIFDVSDPTAPAEIGSLMIFSDAQGGDVEGSRAFGVAYAGIRVLDVSDPTQPQEIGINDLFGGIDIDVVGSLGYVAASGPLGNGLWILDVSDPQAFAVKAWLQLPAMGTSGDVDVDVGAGLAYVALSSGFSVVDVSQPLAPVELGRGVAAGANTVAVVDSLAYVAASAGLKIVGFDLTASECSDGLDNDADGTVDGGDAGCESPNDPSEKQQCADGIDNDGDGRSDAADPGCWGPEDLTEELDCRDGIDNDGDGDVDDADLGCLHAADETEGPDCSDGIDNDQDGLADLADPDCLIPEDNSERSDPVLLPGQLLAAAGDSVIKVNLLILDYSLVSKGGYLADVGDVAMALDGQLFATDNWSGSIIKIDPVTQLQTLVVTGLPLGFAGLGGGLAIEADGSLLVLSDANILRIDPSTAAQSIVAGVTGIPLDLDVGRDGTVYLSRIGFADFSLEVVRIDPQTGQETPIATGMPVGLLGGGVTGTGRLAVEPDGMLLVGAAEELIRIDPASGAMQSAATGDFGGVAALADGRLLAVNLLYDCGKGGCYVTDSTILQLPGGPLPGSYALPEISDLFAIQPACNDHFDNDGDGRIDFDPVTRADAPSFNAGSGDSACQDATSLREDPQCQDGINNDPGQDPDPGLIDFDGGLSALGYVASDPDPQCVGLPWKNKERTGCGIGSFELALILPGLMWLHRRRTRLH